MAAVIDFERSLSELENCQRLIRRQAGRPFLMRGYHTQKTC
jgi:hypothetical protein